MSDHATPTVERHCDVCVIGGSAAGLAAALQLGRQRRSVIVVDAGEPRNAPAAHMHGYLGHEGRPPAALTDAGREEVRSYGGEIITGLATCVTGDETEGFQVALAGGHTVIARRVLAATGLVDELPDIEGLAAHWGNGVIHCPFCHGFEARDERIVLVVTHPLGLHSAALWRQLTSQLTVVVHDPTGVDHGALDALKAGGVDVQEAEVQGVITGPDGGIAAVDLVGGGRIDADAVAIGARFRVRADAFAPVGLVPAAHPTGLGDFVAVDSTGATSVPGVYAAGNLTDPSQQVAQAAAQGSQVAAMISFSLADEDLAAASRSSGNQADWDHRYGGARMWSGNPNGTLVHEVHPLPPGRALDVGAGEGGDAIWLAEQGWRVTASDISEAALGRIRAEVERRQLTVNCCCADANALSPFGGERFDLVSTQYASIPRTPDGRGVRNLLDAVAVGGTLLVVGHDLEPMRTPTGSLEHSRPFDPDAYLGIDDVVHALTGLPGWTIEVNEKRPRPAGAASTHHVDDVVLRARRFAD